MNNITIRHVTEKDAEEICKISCEDLGYNCDVSLVRNKINNLNTDREAVFVATENDTAVGFIHAEKYDTLFLETMANVLGLAVKKAYRNNGIGKALVLSVEKWACENNINTIRLNSGKSRTDAHNFYRNIGFNSKKEQIKFIKTL